MTELLVQTPRVEVFWNYFPFTLVFPYWLIDVLNLIFFPFFILFGLGSIWWNLMPNILMFGAFSISYVTLMVISFVMVFGGLGISLGVSYWINEIGFDTFKSYLQPIVDSIFGPSTTS